MLAMLPETVEEEWKDIPEFTNYLISNLGRIYNVRRDVFMATSLTPFGHVKITLKSEWDGFRYTRSVAQMVAEAFVEPPEPLCDHVAILDGDFTNVAAYNLVWRPYWFVYKYTRQLKVQQPLHFKNLPVCNVETGVVYDSIVEAGMLEGLLFEDIWRSTYTGAALYPDGSVFEIVK